MGVENIFSRQHIMIPFRCLLLLLILPSLLLLWLSIPSYHHPQILHNFLHQLQPAEPNLTVVYWQDQLNETKLLLNLAPQMPNLALIFWNENKKKPMKKNDTCAKLPNLYDLHFNNYWQLYNSNDGTFHLYSAFLDVREQNPLGPTVRILVMVDRHSPWKEESYCQIWFDDSTEPVFVKVSTYHLIYGGTLPLPYMLSCPLPETHLAKVPAAVSLVDQPCDPATNLLKVIFDKPDPADKKQFAVCVKYHYGPNDDISVRLAEWIELLHALGADKIFLYDLGVHPNVKKVTDYYTEKGIVESRQFSLPGFQPNLPLLNYMYLENRKSFKRESELIPINDCFYRNMYKYEYISVQDSDEVIMPIHHQNWTDMMEEALAASMEAMPGKRACWYLRHVYFLDDMLDTQGHGYFSDIPPYMHMMQHVYRSELHNKKGDFIKAFHNPERTLTLHNHFPTACLPNGCACDEVNITVGQLQHYRTECTPDIQNLCPKYRNKTVQDTAIWRWK